MHWQASQLHFQASPAVPTASVAPVSWSCRGVHLLSVTKPRVDSPNTLKRKRLDACSSPASHCLGPRHSTVHSPHATTLCRYTLPAGLLPRELHTQLNTQRARLIGVTESLKPEQGAENRVERLGVDTRRPAAAGRVQEAATPAASSPAAEGACKMRPTLPESGTGPPADRCRHNKQQDQAQTASEVQVDAIHNNSTCKCVHHTYVMSARPPPSSVSSTVCPTQEADTLPHGC